ncbi:MAG: hypothetical protein ACREDD_11470 [Methylocella sp.]
MKILAIALVAFALLTRLHSDASAQDWKVRGLIYVGSFAAGVILGTTDVWGKDKERKGQEAEARLSDLVGKSVPTQVVRPSPGVEIAKAQIAGKVYRLGPGWGTSAEYCISYVSSLCSPCDQQPNICLIRFNEPVLNISGATIR